MIKINPSYLLLILLSLIASTGGLIYFFYALNTLGTLITVILSILGLFIFWKQIKTFNINKPNINIKILIPYLLLVIAQFYILFSSSTSQSIISPWTQINYIFFILHILSTATLILLIFKKQPLPLWIFSIHYFLSFSISLFIYKIGYGYDPFIHEATLRLIDKNGLVNPKHLYYLGQYSIEIILHKTTFIPINILNKFLVPFFSAIILPNLLFNFTKKISNNITINYLVILTILILPFSFLTITVPQNLAYIFLISVILLSINPKKEKLPLIFLLSFTSLIIHPLAGIPAILFSLLLTSYIFFTKKTKYLYSLIFALSVISIPLSFVINKGNSIQDISNISLVLKDFIKIIKVSLPNTENFILNFTYLYIFNLKIIISIFIAIGVIIFIKNKKKLKVFNLYLIISSAYFLSYLLTKYFISFDFLIQNEQGNYSARILLIAILFSIPFIILTLNELLKKLLIQKNTIRIPLIIFLIFTITTSLYASYPRIDNYYNSHGYSVGKYDIEAIKWIEENSQEDYIVLANQQVSAGALNEFGFNNYYNDIFYYPIPTSGKLYPFYLKMVNKEANKKTMQEAMELTGVKKIYFILNKYWWGFDKIKNEAKEMVIFGFFGLVNKVLSSFLVNS